VEKSNAENLIKSDEKTKNEKLSVCSVMKDNVCEIITKLESETPMIFQVYSDVYSNYLHSQRDLFGVCHIAEKQYFDKFEIDPKVLKAFDDYFKSINNVSKYQIDIFQDFLKYYFKTHLSLSDSSDKYIHSMMNLYAKTLSQYTQKLNCI